VLVLRYSPAIIACRKGGADRVPWELYFGAARNKFLIQRLWRGFLAYQSSQSFFDERADLFYEEVDAPYLHRNPTHEAFSGTRASKTRPAREWPRTACSWL
jgi:hypothetical protein